MRDNNQAQLGVSNISMGCLHCDDALTIFGLIVLKNEATMTCAEKSYEKFQSVFLYVSIKLMRGQQNNPNDILYGSIGARNTGRAQLTEQTSKTILPDGRVEYRDYYGELVKLELPVGVNDLNHDLFGPCTAFFQDNQLHRDPNEGPAVIEPDGTQIYWQNGQLHRDDGPAIIYTDGLKMWCQHGEYHREDGPAIIWPSGDQTWYRNGHLHRDDGPAVIFSDGSREYWKHGKFHKKTKPLLQKLKRTS